ncbi:MAG: Cache 3/Cache 2 fusion domain-containing protein [Desulfuromonadales bacterium]|nr:Cache 3/Cache 2 fusion domain-containing protein [Desulfuromonadales bacterium]
MKIKTLLISKSFLIVVLTIFSIIGALSYQKNSLQKNFNVEIARLGQERVSKIVQNVYLMTKAMSEAVEHTMAYNLRVAEEILTKSGPVTFIPEQKVAWTAINQYSKESIQISLPKVYVGNVWLGQNSSFSTRAPVVDKVKSLVGGTCTIFQRMNKQGDMLRVASNVEKQDGSRAIGTYIPRVNPDGTPNPVIETIMQGKVFHGRAYVVNAWYITAYQPIWDAGGKEITGVLYVGVKQENLTSLRHSIMDIVVGSTGYVFVLGGKGAQKGHYIISQNGARDGEDILDSKDSEGNLFVRSIIDKALSIPQKAFNRSIPVSIEKYPWKNPGEQKAREKLAAITYFAPWDWVIVAGYYLDDFRDVENRAEQAIDEMILSVYLIAVLALFFALIASVVTAQRIFSPLEKAVLAFREMSSGNLDIRLPVSGNDEISQLGHAFNDMAQNLRKVTASRDELNSEIAIRKQTEESLITSENNHRKLSQEFATVLDGIQDSLLLLSPDLKIIWANKNATINRGLDEHTSLTGSSCYHWYERNEPCDNCLVLRCLDTGLPQSTTLKTAQGKLMGIKAFPIKDASGNVINVIEMASDITETVRLREEATRNSQLASIGELAAGMAHEINNPNGLIILNLSTLKAALLDALELLDERFEQEGDFQFAGLSYARMREEIPELLHEMHNGAQHIRRIVEDLKDFSRQEAAGVNEVFELNTPIEAAIRLVRNTIKKSTDNFSTRLGSNLPSISGNPQRIEQVAINLLVNAAQALADNSKSISVATYYDEISNSCVFEVKDEGSGIADEHLLHVTDPFFTTKREIGGTGLGLSVSARIIKEHRGELSFEKNHPQGTVVKVSLPVTKDLDNA